MGGRLAGARRIFETKLDFAPARGATPRSSTRPNILKKSPRAARSAHAPHPRPSRARHDHGISSAPTTTRGGGRRANRGMGQGPRAARRFARLVSPADAELQRPRVYHVHGLWGRRWRCYRIFLIGLRRCRRVGRSDDVIELVQQWERQRRRGPHVELVQQRNGWGQFVELVQQRDRRSAGLRLHESTVSAAGPVPRPRYVRSHDRCMQQLSQGRRDGVR